MTLVT